MKAILSWSSGKDSAYSLFVGLLWSAKGLPLRIFSPIRFFQSRR